MKRTIIGLDLENEYSQISYYSDRAGEPETVSIVENQDKYLIPTPGRSAKGAGKRKSQRSGRIYQSLHFVSASGSGYDRYFPDDYHA